jgi:hypothetical protein
MLAQYLVQPMDFLWRLIIFSLGVWLLILLKEGLRYICLRRIGKAQKSYIRGGILWTRGATPYVKCLGAIDIKGYRWSTLLPGMILGWPFIILGFIMANLWIFSAGVLTTASCLADYSVLWRLRGLPKGSWVQDSPFMPGCDVYIPEV